MIAEQTTITKDKLQRIFQSFLGGTIKIVDKVLVDNPQYKEVIVGRINADESRERIVRIICLEKEDSLEFLLEYLLMNNWENPETTIKLMRNL